ncbi:hypothetical protein CRM22_005417 [Opisthorchis felineus]|uniref:Uncharacterized protein n=1 Tax=Opisthorchis felineus TaxID=147828 RepID=A0A4S2LX12_OPIFE|nr:hypothetical protein CRM22_005417 [Opisthorchis felineus]
MDNSVSEHLTEMKTEGFPDSQNTQPPSTLEAITAINSTYDDCSWKKAQQIKSELSKALRKVSGIDEESGTQHRQLEQCGELPPMRLEEKYTDFSILNGSTYVQQSTQLGQNNLQCLLEENALLEERLELYSMERKKLLSDNAYLDKLVDDLQLQLRNVRSSQRPKMLDAATSTTEIGHNSANDGKCRGCIALWSQLQDYVRLYGRLKIRSAKPTTDLISTGPLGEHDNDSECFTTVHLSSANGSQEACSEDRSDGSPPYGKRRTQSACLLTGSRVCVTNVYSGMGDIACQSDLRNDGWTSDHTESHPDYLCTRAAPTHGSSYESVRCKQRLSFRTSALSQALREKSACCRTLKERVSKLEAKLVETQSSLKIARKNLHYWRAKETLKNRKQLTESVFTENPEKLSRHRTSYLPYGSMYYKITLLRKQNTSLRRQVDILKRRLDSEMQMEPQRLEFDRNNNNFSQSQNFSSEEFYSQLLALKQRNYSLTQQLNVYRSSKQTVEKHCSELSTQLQNVADALHTSRQQEQRSKRTVQHLTSCLQKLEDLLQEGDQEISEVESVQSLASQNDSNDMRRVQSHRIIYETSRSLATRLKEHLERHGTAMKELHHKLVETSRQSNRRRGLIEELRKSLTDTRNAQKHLETKLASTIKETNEAKMAEGRLRTEVESQRMQLKAALCEKRALTEQLRQCRRAYDQIVQAHHPEKALKNHRHPELDIITMEKLGQNQLKRVLLSLTTDLSGLACYALREIRTRIGRHSGTHEPLTSCRPLSDASSLPSARSLAQAKSKAAEILGLSLDELDQLTSTMPILEHTMTSTGNHICPEADAVHLIEVASSWPSLCANLLNQSEIPEEHLQQVYQNIMNAFDSVVRLILQSKS